MATLESRGESRTTDPDGDVAGHISVAVIRTPEGFDGIRDSWEQILRVAPASAFQTFEWQHTWWKYFGGGKSLWIVCVREGQTLVAIAPLFIDHRRIPGLRPFRHLRFIGAPLSDYVDLIVRPGYEQVCIRTLAEFLKLNASLWDLLDFESVSAHSPTLPLIAGSFAAAGVPSYTTESTPSPQVCLSPTWNGILERVGPQTRYNIRRKFRRLDRLKHEVERFALPTDNIREAITSFAELHGRRWNSLGYPSAFDNERHREFHIEIAERFAMRGWLRLYFLRVNDERVAVTFNFNYDNRIYMYQCNAHGPRDIMRLSPGLLVRCVSIMEGITEGITLFDFLRGMEPYKIQGWKSWTAENRFIRCISPNARHRSRIYAAQELVRKGGDRMKQEYHEFIRFALTRHPSRRMVLRYLAGRAATHLRLGRKYIARNF